MPAPINTPAQTIPSSPKSYTGEPFRIRLPNTNQSLSDLSVAVNLTTIMAKRAPTSVILLENMYDLVATTASYKVEYWWFNFYDDYIKSESLEYRNGHPISDQARYLFGHVMDRVNSAKSTNFGFLLKPEENWSVSPLPPDQFARILRDNEPGPNLIEKVEGNRSSELTLTMTPAWSALPLETRLAKAKNYWSIWSRNRFPENADHVFIKLVNSKGEKIGGSGILGAAISVVN
jgi:hypothetical protein